MQETLFLSRGSPSPLAAADKWSITKRSINIRLRCMGNTVAYNKQKVGHCEDTVVTEHPHVLYAHVHYYSLLYREAFQIHIFAQFWPALCDSVDCSMPGPLSFTNSQHFVQTCHTHYNNMKRGFMLTTLGYQSSSIEPQKHQRLTTLSEANKWRLTTDLYRLIQRATVRLFQDFWVYNTDTVALPDYQVYLQPANL